MFFKIFTTAALLSLTTALKYDDDEAIKKEIEKYANSTPYMNITYSSGAKDTLKAGKIRLEFEMFFDKAPKTCLNFLKLLEGYVNENGDWLGYKGSTIHRIVHEFVIQGGDFTRGDGTGGMSIYENSPEFKDENFWYKHEPGVLSMANRGPNTNGSQFFIAMGTFEHLDGKHVVFGKVKEWIYEGMVDTVNGIFSNTNDYRPLHPVTIDDCGVLNLELSEKRKMTFEEVLYHEKHQEEAMEKQQRDEAERLQDVVL